MPTLEKPFISFISPNIGDLLFYEVVNSDVARNAHPEYEQLHRKQNEYPGYKLVFISLADEEGMQKWFYAKDRADQEDYNWEVSYPYAGLQTCPRFACTYVLPRKGYSPLDRGTPHPLDLGDDTPEKNSRFKGAKLLFEKQVSIAKELESVYISVMRVYDKVPSLLSQEVFNASYEYPYQSDHRYPRTIRKYVVSRSDLPMVSVPAGELDEGPLAFRRVDRFEGQMEDSLYVLLTVAHDKIPDVTDTVTGGQNFLKGFGFVITRPFGLAAYPRVTWRIPRVTTGFSPTANYETCPITGYTGLKLVSEQHGAEATNANQITLVRVYDTLPGPELPTTRKVKPADIPEKFIDLRVDLSGVQPVDNAATAATPADLPDDVAGAILQTSLGPEGSSGLVFNKGNARVVITHGPISGWEMDMATGILLPFTQEVVPAGTAGDAINSSGVYSEVAPINRFYSIKTTRKSTGLAGLEGGKTWEGVMNYSWPPVLSEINFFSILLLSGETARIGWDLYLKSGYSGPCRAIFTETWTLTPPSVTVPIQMQPEAIDYDGIYIRNFNTPRCLHDEIVIYEATGSSDPVYANQIKAKTFAATNYLDWPESIIASNAPVPFGAGYKITTIEVFSPNFPTP